MKHRRIRLIEGNATLFVFKRNLQKDFAAVVYLFEALSLPGFLCWGVQTNFNSEPSHTQFKKKTAQYGLQHDSTSLPPTHTYCLHIISHRWVGRVELVTKPLNIFWSEV
jgi:hypothetical protein